MSDVRVGIVAWNVADELAACLAALPQALGELDAEVVVVDNASSDASPEVADRAGVQVIRSPRNLGYARGMNLALAGTGARALMALNPDTVPLPGSLASLVRTLDARPDVGLVVPRLLDPHGDVEQSVHPFPSLGIVTAVNLLPGRLLPPALRDRWWLRGSIRPERSAPVPWATGAVHCIRRDAIGEGPPYSERWFIFVEDLDLCWRLAQQGWIRYLDADAVVVHVGNVSGRRAFGGARTARWVQESYDWYGHVHGPVRTRLFALVNLMGTLRHLLPSVVRRRTRLRHHPELRVHLRCVVAGPPGPAGPL